MKKFYLLTCFLSVFLYSRADVVEIDGVSQDKTYSAGPFYERGPRHSMDLHHINWSDFKDILPSHVAGSRGTDSNLKWIDRIGNMPGYLNDFYQLYGEQVKGVMNGGTNWLSDPSLGNYDSNYNSYEVTIKDIKGSVGFTFPVGSSPSVIYDNAYEAVVAKCGAIWEEANCFLQYLIFCLNYDFPEAFWTGNGARWGYNWGYSYSYDPSAGTGTAEYDFILTFTLKEYGFDIRIDGFQSPQLISDAVTEFNAKVQSVTDLVKGLSRYEKIVGLNDWLTMHNSYNSDLIQTGDADPIAWSPLSALRESTGALGPVCEGYSRAFKVLCDKLGIPCILAVGNAKGSKYDSGEAHMWNEVQMGNEKWYAVDVTWNDPTGGNPGKVSGFENRFWLLLGKNDVVATDLTFAESHPNTPVDDVEYLNVWDILFASLITDTHYEYNGESEEETDPDDPTPDPTPDKETIQISAAKQVPYYSEYDLDFTDKADLKAYVATGYDKSTGTIWLTRVKQVPAETGFLLVGEEGTYEIPVSESASDVYYKNMFKGTLTGTTIQTTEGEYTNYYLSKGTSGVGFYKVTNADGQKIGANRCYLPILTDIPADGAEGDAEVIRVSAAKQVPYYTSKNIDFTSLDAQGVKAYTATGYNYGSGVIWLTRVKKVPAQTGILVMADEAGEYSVPTTSVASHYENMFTGSEAAQTIYTTETVGDITYINYYLSNGTSGIGFYKVTNEDGVSMGANRSYLQIPKRDSAGARGMYGNASFCKMVISDNDDDVIAIPVYGGDATGIINTQFQNAKQDVYYNLQGQRVNNPGKGLYIKNGHKVVIK